MDKKDNLRFLQAMQRLSTALSTELTDMRLETYWDALVRMPIEAVEWACRNAVEQFIPTHREPFPVPARLREYAQMYREVELSKQAAIARTQLAQWSETPDEVGIQALRDILAMLGDHMEMPTQHPAYQAPSLDDPEKRRAELLEQARQVMTQNERTNP